MFYIGNSRMYLTLILGKTILDKYTISRHNIVIFNLKVIFR